VRHFRAGRGPIAKFNPELPLGPYLVQVVYFDRYLSPCPFGEGRDGSIQQWYREYPGEPLISSEMATVEFVSAGVKDK
jgi:hypothetical protein